MINFYISFCGFTVEHDLNPHSATWRARWNMKWELFSYHHRKHFLPRCYYLARCKSTLDASASFPRRWFKCDDDAGQSELNLNNFLSEKSVNESRHRRQPCRILQLIASIQVKGFKFTAQNIFFFSFAQGRWRCVIMMRIAYTSQIRRKAFLPAFHANPSSPMVSMELFCSFPPIRMINLLRPFSRYFYFPFFCCLFNHIGNLSYGESQ